MENKECMRKAENLRKNELLWIIGVYVVFLILIGGCLGMMAANTETKDSEYLAWIFFSVLTLIVTSFSAYYFCCAYFAPPSQIKYTP
jgi:hypothetical protein